MCEPVYTFEASGKCAAILYSLCADRRDLGGKVATHKLTCCNALKDDSVFPTCVASFHASTHCLLELSYFDVDYRSTAQIYLLHHHRPVGLTTNRIVFLSFDSEPGLQTGNLTEALDSIERADVQGYIVLTPDDQGPIGRSIIPPLLTLDGLHPSVNLAEHIRTTVSEQITVLGSRKQVTGLPFVEQDGHVISCAHASAWMVHYSAVLRGLAVRRFMGEFHLQSTEAPVEIRAYPSDGLTPSQVATMLGQFGLPVVVLTKFEILSSARWATWFDRSSIWDICARLAGTGLSSARTANLANQLTAARKQAPSGRRKFSAARQILYEDWQQFWALENITRPVCQYLNSGFPCIVLDAVRNHAYVLNGYLRARDFAPGTALSNASAPSDVVAFVVSDDQEGPCVLKTAEELKRLLMVHGSSIVVPLPRGTWLSAERAETEGALAFERAIKSCVRHVGAFGGQKPGIGRANANIAVYANPDELTRTTSRLERIQAEIAAPTDPVLLSIRSYLVPGTDWKQSIANRCPDALAVDRIRLASLPRFVWVVEIMEREKREDHEASVIGEVVLDATHIGRVKVAVMHLPGALQVDVGTAGRLNWEITGKLEVYRSGRYHGAKAWATDAAATAGRTKLAHR